MLVKVEKLNPGGHAFDPNRQADRHQCCSDTTVHGDRRGQEVHGETCHARRTTPEGLRTRQPQSTVLSTLFRPRVS